MMPAIPWEEKERRIREKHPDALDVSWDEAIRSDPDLFARIVSDVVKSSSGGSKPGKRPALESSEAFGVFSQMMGEDFSDLPFVEAFNILCEGKSLRGVQAKTGLGHSYIAKLQSGEAQPSYDAMERIAKGFKKDPSYFIEYRIGFINNIIGNFLMASPETSVSWYFKMKGKG